VFRVSFVYVMFMFCVCFAYVLCMFCVCFTAALGPRGRSQIEKKQEKIREL